MISSPITEQFLRAIVSRKPENFRFGVVLMKKLKPVLLNSRTAAQCEEMIRSDLPSFLRTVQREFAIGSHKVIYNAMQAAAHLTLAIEADPEKKEELLKQEPLASRRKRPLKDAQLAMQSVMNANDENSRQGANRKGTVVGKLLRKGMNPEQIAKQLSTEGGVSGAIRFLFAEDEPDDDGQSAEDGDDADREDDDEEDDEEEDPHRDQRERPKQAGTTASKRSAPRSLKVPPAAEGYGYIYLEVPIADIARHLKPGEREVSYEACRLSSGWVQLRIVEDEDENDKDEDDGEE